MRRSSTSSAPDEPVHATRGAEVCTWREAERVLAGFPDGRADEGPTAVGPSLLGLNIARERGWSAPPMPEPRRSWRPMADERMTDPSTGSGLDLLTPVLTENWGDERAWKLTNYEHRGGYAGAAHGAGR